MNMRKRILSLLLIVLIAVNLCPISPIAAELPEVYEVYNSQPTFNDGGTYLDFRIRPVGSNEIGTKGYCFNYDRQAPDSIPSGYDPVGPYYRLEHDVSNDIFLKYADYAGNNPNLKQDVLNVVWNGYPYYQGGWGTGQTWFDSTITQ